MKLGKSGRDELRKKVESQLALVPDGQRIHLEKEVLEELLFEKVVLNEENPAIKIPVWSGPFLRKIDLSEISFENVSWCIIHIPDEKLLKIYKDMFNLELDGETLQDDWAGLEDFICLNHEKRIDYSNTNANIDFNISYFHDVFGRKNGFSIECCNFYGTDLSNNDFSNLSYIGNSNLSNTGIKLSPTNFECIDFFTDLSNNDFSSISINVNEIGNHVSAAEGQALAHINVSGTSLNIIIPDINKVEDPDDFEYSMFGLSEAVNRGYLNGCYINGKAVKSPSTKEQQEAIKSSKKAEYEKYKNEIIDSVLGGIDEQIGGKKR